MQRLFEKPLPNIILTMLTDNYKVSILVPIYGVERYIERCAISLMEQTYGNVEFVFVDDCGKDRSMEILREVVSRYPDRAESVKIIRHEHNRGLAAARNTAIAAASGEFIMHVDSDDWVDKTIVEKLVRRQQQTGADIVMTDYKAAYPDHEDIIIFPEANDNNDLCVKQLYTRQRWCVWAQIVRRRLYIDNAIRAREGCNMGEDLHTSPRLSYCAKHGISYLHEPLYYYNMCNESSYTTSFNENICRQVDGGYDELEEFFADKGASYIDAIRLSRLTTYVGYLRRMSIVGGFDELYAHYREQVTTLAPRYAHKLSVLKRLIIKVSSHRRLVKLLSPEGIIINKK